MTSCRANLGGTSILALLFSESIECFWHLLILNSDAPALAYRVSGIARKNGVQVAYSAMAADINRRDFIGGLATVALTSSNVVASIPADSEMPYRELGKTGRKVSCIGLGGYHIGQSKLSEPDAIKLFQTAVGRGINFSDNSWDYNNGESERRVGKALKGRRDSVFVMTKFDGRTKDLALKQLDESLQRLQVDYVDLWQFHENIRLEDPDRFFAQGGAVEAVLQARQAGKIRHVGFTGHKDPVVHLRMLDMADKHNFRFDTVQMPLNVMDAHFRSFGKQVLPVLVRKDIGVLGMKPLASGYILTSKTVPPLQCLQYALHLPTSVVITGIDSMQVLDQACEAARTYSKLTSSDVEAILAKSAPAAGQGKFEPFKTTPMFDATASHPEWLG
jgi:aryl-alcohol dehydrogenase-like predicted oxidoreductase